MFFLQNPFFIQQCYKTVNKHMQVCKTQLSLYPQSVKVQYKSE